VRPVLQVDAHPDHIDAHVDHMSARRAVVSGPGVALEGVGEISAVQEMVAKVVVTSPDRLLDAVGPVVLEVGVKLLKFDGSLLSPGLHPIGHGGWEA